MHARLARQCSIIQLHLQSGHLYFANFLTEMKNGLLFCFWGGGNWRVFLFCFSFVCFGFSRQESLCVALAVQELAL